jgi:phosphoribosylaminoimidazole (AIR) synthetase
MFEYFNCGIDYILIVDHTKSSVENILQQLTQTHTTSFLLGTFISTSNYFSKH